MDYLYKQGSVLCGKRQILTGCCSLERDCAAVSTAEGFLKSQMEPPVPKTLRIVAFLHRGGQDRSALRLLLITKSSEMLSKPASYGYPTRMSHLYFAEFCTFLKCLNHPSSLKMHTIFISPYCSFTSIQ